MQDKYFRVIIYGAFIILAFVAINHFKSMNAQRLSIEDTRTSFS